jgi:hypothetical protein
MTRSPNPESLAGSKALADINNNEVQGSPDNLGRIHTSLQKQIALNKRVLEKEDEVAHINSELSDFLNSMDLTKPTFVFLNVRERMRGTQPVCVIIIHFLGQAPKGWLATPNPTPTRDRIPTQSLRSLTPCSDDSSRCCLNSLDNAFHFRPPQSCSCQSCHSGVSSGAAPGRTSFPRSQCSSGMGSMRSTLSQRSLWTTMGQ